MNNRKNSDLSERRNERGRKLINERKSGRIRMFGQVIRTRGYRKALAMLLTLGMLTVTAGCGSGGSSTERKDGKGTEPPASTAAPAAEQTELTILAAASLTDVCGELKTMYEESHKGVTLTFSFAGSGALQTQIEEGAPADIFISAAQKQMKALKEKNLMKEESICDLLENKVVLVTPAENRPGITSFEDVKKDEVKLIGLGEVESVPAGQYAKTIFTSLNMWDVVEKKANFGTDVRTVLGWVETSAVDCGVVYATDAYTSDKVKIVAEAPAGSCDPVIYPAGLVAAGKNQEAAQEFLNFLKSDEAMKVFEKYGFVSAGK